MIFFCFAAAELFLVPFAAAGCALDALWRWTTGPADRRKDRRPPTPDMALAVIRDLHDRRLVGMDRYGTPLLADTLADPLWAAYEEWMDQGVYLRAEIEKRKAKVA